MSNTTTTFVAGDVVWGRPVRAGKAGARRKGLVLGYLHTDATQVIVWWYGEGDASMDTTTMAFPRELTCAGDMFDLSGKVALKLAKGCRDFYRAASVQWSLARHASRMLAL